MQSLLIAEKIQILPESLLREVEDFVDFLLARYTTTKQSVDSDLSPALMTRLAATGGAFEWLNDPSEDIYSDEDGEIV